MKLKCNYAEIHDIEEDVIDHKTQKTYDTGVCSHCGLRTKIAQERFIGKIFGKSEKHFCDNCGVFLRSNPLHSVFFGLAQGTFFLILFLVIVANMKAPASASTSASTAQNVFFLILFLGMIDGIRRSFAGIQGILGEKKNPSDASFFSQQVIYQDAVESCKQAIRIKPDLAEAHCGLGAAYDDLGHYQDAIESCKQAIRIKPDLAEAHCNLGVAYGQLGRYQDAIESCKQAIRIKPDYANAHFTLGSAYGQLDRWQDAVESYKQAIKIKPDDSEAHYNLGFAYLRVSDKDSTLKEYKILKNLDTEKANKLFDLIYK